MSENSIDIGYDIYGTLLSFTSLFDWCWIHLNYSNYLVILSYLSINYYSSYKS